MGTVTLTQGHCPQFLILALALELLRCPVSGASLFELGLRAREVGFCRGALERFLAMPRSVGPAEAPAPARPSAPATPAADALEDEAYEAAEIEGRLGTSEDEEWKPFRVEVALRKGWHVNANPAGRTLIAPAWQRGTRRRAAARSHVR